MPPAAIVRTVFLAVVLAALASVGGRGVEAADRGAAPAGAAERLEWFREAKFGMMVHWGLYSIPAGEWKGRRSTGIGEWIMHRLRIPRQEYAGLAGGFNPRDFDAESWVRLAAEAGMKYIVVTAKHHDGFAMYGSKVSPYNIVDATPFGRDPLKEIADACARHHVRFGIYYSQVLDWNEPGGGGLAAERSNVWDFPPVDEADPGGLYEKYISEKAVPQVRELLQNYGPIAIVWFDGPGKSTHDVSGRFIEAVRSLQPNTLISGRLKPGGTGGDYISTGDNNIPAQYLGKEAWEVPATMNQTWGFRKDDDNWKSPGEILFKLVDVVSKGGNYLLNVGPTAEGVIPAPSQQTLRAVGRWLKINGEAVYSSGASPFGDEFGEASAKFRLRNEQPVFLVNPTWRCTTKPGKLYFTIFHAEREGTVSAIFPLPAFPNQIRALYMLDDPAHTPLQVATRPDGTRVVTIPNINDSMGSVLVVEIAGDRFAPQAAH